MGGTVGTLSGSPRSATESVLQQTEKSEIHDFSELQVVAVIHENDLTMTFMNVEGHEDTKRSENIMTNEIITIHPDFNESENQN